MKNKILKLLNENNTKDINQLLEDMNIVDIAMVIEELDNKQVLSLFKLIPSEEGAIILSYLSQETRLDLLETLTDDEIASIVDNLFLDDTVDIIEDLPTETFNRVLKVVDSETRNNILNILNYPDDSAGSVMTVEFLDLNKEMTVGEAIEKIKTTGIDKETISNCYVTDDKNKLEGVVSIKQLILTDDHISINSIMDTDIKSVNTIDDQEEITRLCRKYDFLTLPVVDSENKLMGIVTIDDVIDIIDDENTEDLEKMAAMQPSDNPYLKTSVISLSKNRVLWLLILVISATITGNIMISYEHVLETVTILTAFLPMLMDAGGNAGSQSATLIIRGMALDQIKSKDFLRVIWKEIRVSLIVGVTLAAVNLVRIIYLEKQDFAVSLTVSLTLIFTIMMANIIGVTLPIVAKKLKLDPALMATPVITTIVDALTVLIYFNLATVLLGIA